MAASRSRQTSRDLQERHTLLQTRYDCLTKFRQAIGINIGTQDADLESARRGPRGLYKEVISKQRRSCLQYHSTDIVLYLSLGAQIVIGASLTALGPLSQLHSTSITVLGAINTSIAGLLALLKGQGLPDRFRKDQFEMRKVQDFIEETESRLILAGNTLTMDDIDRAVQKVFLKFNAARDTAEKNRPDCYGHQPEGSPEPRPRVPISVDDQTDIVGNGNGKGKDAVVR